MYYQKSGLLRPYVGGELLHNLTLSDKDQGPDVDLPNDDLHKLLNDDNHDDDAPPDILKNQSCNYLEPDEVYKLVDSKSFSILSHNIRSLSGHFESLKRQPVLNVTSTFFYYCSSGSLVHLG